VILRADLPIEPREVGFGATPAAREAAVTAMIGALKSEDGSRPTPTVRASSGKIPETHSVGSIGDDNLGVFIVVEMPMEIADASTPAHRIPQIPDAGYRRCHSPSVPLARLARRAGW
jgi:hypothetical protein